MGAVITVLAIALDPFAQQLVQYEYHSRNTTDPGTVVARAKRYDKGNEYQVFDDDLVYASADFSMQSAILYGLAQPYNTVAKQTSFNCAVGNCTWSPYDSLAVCSSCNNVNAQLSPYQGSSQLFSDLDQSNGVGISQTGTSYGLPNGLFISNIDGKTYKARLGPADEEYGWVYLTAYGTGNTSRTNTFQDNDSLIWAMSFINMTAPADTSLTWPHIPLEATECALYYCVKQFTSEVINATLHETEAVALNATRNSDSWQPAQTRYTGVEASGKLTSSLLFNNETSMTQRTDLSFGDGYNLSQRAVDGVSSYMQAQFKITEDFNNSADTEGMKSPAGVIAPADLTLNGYYISNGAIQYSPPVMQTFYESSNLTDTFRTLAKSMSNTIRADADNQLHAIGISKIMNTYYRIEWPWITLHAALLLAGLVFFFITILKTNRMGVPVLKSNALAPLAQVHEFGTSLAGLRTTSAIDSEASRHFVQLFKDEGAHHVDGEAIELIKSHPR